MMLRNLIEFHKQEFLQQGGIREEMTRGRLTYRNSHPTRPSPVAGNTMLGKREQELDEREARIAQKERDLEQKEAELLAREKELARLIKMGMIMGGIGSDGE